MTGTGHHCPRPRPRHPAPSQTEHHQIHAVDQHSGHLNRIGPGIWYHREPAQIRPHLHRGQQPDIRLANDGRVSPAAVTDATMLSSSDRAPDSTPTVPGATTPVPPAPGRPNGWAPGHLLGQQSHLPS